MTFGDSEEAEAVLIEQKVAWKHEKEFICTMVHSMRCLLQTMAIEKLEQVYHREQATWGQRTRLREKLEKMILEVKPDQLVWKRVSSQSRIVMNHLLHLHLI